MTPPAPLALFDFDGTISRGDSFMAFMKHTHGLSRFAGLMLRRAPVYLGWKLGAVSSQTAKCLAIADFYSGREVGQIDQWRSDFNEHILRPMIFPKATERIQWHLNQGHEVAVVTASSPAWLSDWANENSVVLLGTELEIKDRHYTGLLSTPNCIGTEKVRRVLARWPDATGREIYAYGNDRGDRELLSFATFAHHRLFER